MAKFEKQLQIGFSMYGSSLSWAENKIYQTLLQLQPQKHAKKSTKQVAGSP